MTNLPSDPHYPSDDTEGWRSLPAKLFAEVLGLKNRISHAQSMINHELADGDLIGLEINRYASDLGLEAFRIAKELRLEFTIPEATLDWDYPSQLLSAKAKVGEADMGGI